MSFTPRLRALAPCVLAALTLGLAACSADESEPVPAVTVTTTVEASAPADPAPETSKTSEVVETSLASSDETAVGPNDESGVIDVTVVGDQGILALQHSGNAPDGGAGPAHNQKLIAGPGGCLAMTNEGKPQLLVFPADATFVLQGGKPSATVGGIKHVLGHHLEVPATTVEKNNVAGIPDACMQGSDDTVIVIN